MAWRHFNTYFATYYYSKFSMDMYGFNPSICCYDITALALPKYAALSNIYAGIFGNAENFAWCLS